MPMRVPFGGSVRWMRLMTPLRYTENVQAARGRTGPAPADCGEQAAGLAP